MHKYEIQRIVGIILILGGCAYMALYARYINEQLRQPRACYETYAGVECVPLHETRPPNALSLDEL